jgi:hypothetical protein
MIGAGRNLHRTASAGADTGGPAPPDKVVSIIIPCFQQGHYLGEAIASALAQSHQPLEVIVVNDGSTDATEEVARGYAERIRYIRRANGGLSAARNTGLRAAEGDYLLFLDADDALHPDSVSVLVQGMNGRTDRLSLMGCRFFTDTLPTADVPGAIAWDAVDLLPALLQVNLGPCHAWLSPRCFVEEAGGFCEGLRACEDWDLWLRLAELGLHGARTTFAGAYYRQYPGSMSTDPSRMLRARSQVLLRAHDAIMATLERTAPRHFEEELLRAERRVRRRLMVAHAERPLIEAMTARIHQLMDRGTAVRRSVPARVLQRLLGDSSEQLLLWYLRWFKPRVFERYRQGYA